MTLVLEWSGEQTVNKSQKVKEGKWTLVILNKNINYICIEHFKITLQSALQTMQL